MFRSVKGTLLIAAASLMCGMMSACQSPTEPTNLDYIDVDAPTTAAASGPTGRTYRIAATSTEPSQIVEYPWVTRFTVTLRMTQDASNKDGALDFPVKVTNTAFTVSAASGGIVVPPPTGTQIYSEIVPFASGNQFNAVGETVTITFDVYYHLPSGGKEALINLSFTLQDDDNNSFGETAQVRVAP
jgi:hypothetical protein